MIKMTDDSKIEKGIVKSRRKVIDIGDSKAVTLSKKWLDIQKWLGNEITEISALALNEVIVLVPPGMEEKAERILREIEKEGAEE